MVNLTILASVHLAVIDLVAIKAAGVLGWKGRDLLIRSVVNLTILTSGRPSVVDLIAIKVAGVLGMWVASTWTREMRRLAESW